MNKYPKVENLKSISESLEFKNVEIKVENQRMQGENVTLVDGVFTHTKNQTKEVKKSISKLRNYSEKNNDIKPK